jgi:hypothetical protein
MRIPRTVCVGSRSERALTIPVRTVRAFFNRVCGDRLLVRNDGCEIPTSARSSRRQSPARYRRAPDLGRVDRSARIGNGILTPAPVRPSSSSASPGGASSQELSSR